MATARWTWWWRIFNSTNVSVLLGQRRRHLPAGDELRGRHATPIGRGGDFNGDGKLDFGGGELWQQQREHLWATATAPFNRR